MWLRQESLCIVPTYPCVIWTLGLHNTQMFTTCPCVRCKRWPRYPCITHICWSRIPVRVVTVDHAILTDLTTCRPVYGVTVDHAILTDLTTCPCVWWCNCWLRYPYRFWLPVPLYGADVDHLSLCMVYLLTTLSLQMLTTCPSVRCTSWSRYPCITL